MSPVAFVRRQVCVPKRTSAFNHGLCSYGRESLTEDETPEMDSFYRKKEKKVRTVESDEEAKT